MLHTNLSTRPFYNERAVYLALAVAAFAVLAVSVFNARRLVTLSRQNTELTRRVADQQAETEELNRQTEAIRSGTSRTELEAVSAAAKEVNDIIDQRTFSWTEFLNLIEGTLPADVMLMAVRPQIREGVVNVSMTVVGRSTADLDTFMEQLEKTGRFADLLPRQEEVTEDGLHRAIINGRYRGLPAAPIQAPGETTAKAGPRS